jgi:hypothetical protein
MVWIVFAISKQNGGSDSVIGLPILMGIHTGQAVITNGLHSKLAYKAL